MKKKSKNKLTYRFHWAGAMILFGLALCFSCKNQTAEEHDLYTCPMHPEVLQDKPGMCPICGMDLVLKSKHGADTLINDTLPAVRSSDEAMHAPVQTITAVKKSLPVQLKVAGTVTYDPRNT